MNGLKFRQELEKLIAAEVKSTKDTLAAGNLPNMREYRYFVGHLRGLTQAVGLMDIAATKTEER